MKPTDRIAEHYRQAAATHDRARDAKIAAGFKQNDHMDRVEQVAAADRDKLSPQTRMALGLYQDARAAAQRLAAAGGDAQ